jgi:membrane protein implicated in regulation of membrane protease activity
MNFEPWHIWATVALLLLIAEIFAPTLILGCLAVGAVGGLIGDLLGLGWQYNSLIASATSILSLIFLRPMAMQHWFSGSGTKTGVEAIIGRVAELSTDVDVSSGSCRCKVDGDDWKAIIDTSNLTREVKKGSKVEIIAVNSAVVTVRPI